MGVESPSARIPAVLEMAPRDQRASQGQRKGFPAPADASPANAGIGVVYPGVKSMRVVLSVTLVLMISLSGCAGDDGGTQDAAPGTSTSTATDTTSSVRMDSSTTTTIGTLSVVAGIVEPDANYPWVVHIPGGGCGGVLIDRNGS